MIQIGVCDDRPQQIEIIKNALINCEKERGDIVFNISCFDGSFSLLEELEKGVKFDVLLLDICMPGILGTDVAKSVRRNKDKTEIVFITSSAEFAVDAFALKAAHYLIKPFTQLQFNEAMARAVARMITDDIKTINIKTKEIFREICIDEILFIESFSHEQVIHMMSGENLETRQTLSGILAELEVIVKGQFISPCKGYAVNMKNAKILTKNGFVMPDEQIIPLAQRSFAKVKELYFNFKFGKNS